MMNKCYNEQENGLKIYHSDQAFQFEMGGEIAELVLAFETYGELSSGKDNVILIHHALSTDSHVASHDKNPEPGWWEAMVGPHKPIDTGKYFVICINNLGSCYGSSGPTSINPNTSNAYQSDFPTVTIGDMLNAQKRLLSALGIDALYAVIGNSMGAMLSLQMAVMFPSLAKKILSISSCYKAYPVNIANRSIQRDIIQLDPAWKQGHYQQQPQQGFKLARKIGHISYRNATEMNERFHHDGDEINSYLEYNATKFISKFDANCYLSLLEAMDLFDISKGYASAEEALKRIKSEILCVSVDSDILYPPPQQIELKEKLMLAGVKTQYIEHHSQHGHDSFLVETDIFGNYIKSFLEKQ